MTIANDVRQAPTLPGPRYPKTERQAEIMTLAEELSAIAAENAPAHDHDGTFPFDTFEAISKTPYLALTVPEEFGGGGAGPLDVMLAQEILARGDGSVALVASMHLGHVAGIAVNAQWPPDLKERFFREIVERGALYNTAASEPGLGSPSRGGHYATRAVRDSSGGWRIAGRKAWGTGSPALTWAGVGASVEEESGELVRASFLVPMDAPDVSIEETWDNMAMSASGSHDIVLNDVVVPADHRLPAAGKPEGGPWSILTSATYLGIGVAARNWAIAFAKGRRPTALGGKAIAELEGVQARIAQMELLLLEARSVLYGTVEMWKQQPELQDELGAQFAAAKVIVTNNAIAVTDQAMRIVGSVGLQRKNPLERYFRDVRAGLGNPPLDDVAMGIVARNALK
ncbi:MAG TPA: acyl-CoA dehydrogenase family protein [Thermomicrobiales bacterium]|nr:acyl-CoA dehydrogenase family protein [Thermomicrobiales bacterium]